MTDDRYWLRTRRLTIVLIFIWTVVTFVLTWFAPELNGFSVFGFPLGFYMAAQGSLIAFVVLCFWNASAQEKIDEEFGVSDE